MINKKNIELLLEPINNIPIYADIFTQNISSEEHSHKYVELVAVLEGTATHLMNNQRQDIKYGDVFVVKVGAKHKYVDFSPNFTVINLSFVPQNLLIWHLDLPSVSGYKNILYGSYNEQNEYPFIHFEADKFKEILVLLHGIVKASENRIKGSQFHIFTLFMTLIYHITIEYSQYATTTSRDNYKTTQAIEYINKFYRESISIEKLCNISKMTKTTLLRKFKESTGFTPTQYIIEFRISKSCELLLADNLNITEISFAVGFGDVNYFCRQFKKIMGITPREYQKRYYS